ncbi:MAG: hypothetical protein ACKVQK_16615 [Burkholderiales bacterium]
MASSLFANHLCGRIHHGVDVARKIDRAGDVHVARGAQILTSKRGIGHRQTRTLNIIDDMHDFFETRNDGCALFKSPKHGPFEKFSCRHTFSWGSI